MSKINPTVSELLARYERACNFNRPVDSQTVERNLAEFYRALKIGVPPITQHSCFKNYSWEAWEAREARAARQAWAAWEISWVCITYIGAIEKNDPKTAEIWRPLFEAFEAGLWIFLPMNKGCPWFQIPRVRTELNSNRSRCHCETGPAFELPQKKLWFIHGVLVPQYVVENPKAITVEDIEGEKNAEVRRVKIERYGQARYLLDAGAAEIHRDDYGTLYRKDVLGDEPLVMVKVVNATPEADGSSKDYFIRVPPTMERARQAVAWSFNKEEMDYAPEVQT